MRSNLTTAEGWFIVLICLKLTVRPDFSWWVVFLPQILIPVEAVATLLLQKHWLRIVYWYNIQVIKADGRIRLWIANRQAKKAYNKANQNKFKI